MIEPRIYELGNIIRETWLHFIDSNHRISVETVLHFANEKWTGLVITIIIIIMTAVTTVGVDVIFAIQIGPGIVLYT